VSQARPAQHASPSPPQGSQVPVPSPSQVLPAAQTRLAQQALPSTPHISQTSSSSLQERPAPVQTLN
jgi:hypothetical protein